MLSFKSTTSMTFWSVDPRLKFWDIVWSSCYWRTHFSSFLAILPLFCSRVRSKCSSSSSALEVKQETKLFFFVEGRAARPSSQGPAGADIARPVGGCPAHPRPLDWSFRKLLGPSAGAEPPPNPTAHSLLFLCIQVPDERVTLVHQGHQLIQQELLASLLGLSLLPVCRQGGSLSTRRTSAHSPSPSRLFQFPCISPQTIL